MPARWPLPDGITNAGLAMAAGVEAVRAADPGAPVAVEPDALVADPDSAAVDPDPAGPG
jgi:hypothetical protein